MIMILMTIVRNNELRLAPRSSPEVNIRLEDAAGNPSKDPLDKGQSFRNVPQKK